MTSTDPSDAPPRVTQPGLTDARAGRPRLADLTAPLSEAEFYVAHWRPGEPLLARANPAIARVVRSVGALANVEALLGRYKREVALFGPDASRVSVPARAAPFFLARGYNLFFVNVEESVPEARALFEDAAAELGFGPGQIRVEAFCGRAGGLSSRHYDNDINFQVLLEGTKDWVLEKNENIGNPLQSVHLPGDFGEEAYARAPALPGAFDPAHARRVRATAGSVLFLPRAYWHETRSVTDTWGVNLVLKGVTWADALGRAITHRLERDERFRAYCDGHRGRAPSDLAREDRRARFAAMRRAAAAALDQLVIDEVALSAEGDHIYAWSPKAAGRRVQQRGDACELVAAGLHDPLPLRGDAASAAQRLCALACPFKWKHALAAAPGIPADLLHGLLEDLVARGLLALQH